MLELVGTYCGFAAELALMWFVSDYYREPWDPRRAFRRREKGTPDE